MSGFRRIGLVLEGGGAKGAFSLGFARKCHELEIEFSAISGTSVGGLNAWLAATEQFDAGEALWTELSFTDIYAPRLFPWRPVAAVLFVIHSYQHWLQGLSPAPDSESKTNNILIALFRAITFLPLVQIYMALVRAPDFVAAAGTIAIAAYALFPLVRLVRAQPRSDYGERDQTLDGLPGQILGLLFLTYLVAVGMTIYRAVTGDFGEAEWHILIYGAAVIAATFLGSLANLVDAPLTEIIDRFVKAEPRVPCFVTTAERVSRYSLDEPNVQALSGAPDEGLEYTIHPSTHFLPHYHDLRSFSADRRRVLLRATAALPFGLVNEVSFAGMAFVDGGMADNLPALPLLEHDLDLIVAVRLRQADGNQEAWLEREIRRIARLRDLPEEIPYLGHFNTAAEAVRSLRAAVETPVRAPLHIPMLKVVCPKADIGSLLDFSGAAEKIKLGEEAAVAFAAEFGLGRKPQLQE